MSTGGVVYSTVNIINTTLLRVNVERVRLISHLYEMMGVHCFVGITSQCMETKSSLFTP